MACINLIENNWVRKKNMESYKTLKNAIIFVAWRKLEVFTVNFISV